MSVETIEDLRRASEARKQFRRSLSTAKSKLEIPQCGAHPPKAGVDLARQFERRNAVARPALPEVKVAPLPSIKDISDAVGRYFRLSEMDLISPRRTCGVVYPRQIAMFLARTMTMRSLPYIGQRMGGRDHTTVLHGTRRIEALLAAGDGEVIADVEAIKQMIEAGR